MSRTLIISLVAIALIVVAVFTIGAIGFLLDRVMVIMQRLVSFDAAPAGL